ncbi:MAG: ATP-binding protein [Chloroflexota bacterium]|nr:ATP-binding protein [Chloroflexota bacterium]
MAAVLDTLSPMLDLIVLSAVRLASASGGAVALFDEDGTALHVRASHGLSTSVLAQLHPAQDALILGALGRAGQAITVPRRDDRGEMPGPILSLPLNDADDRLLGVLYVVRRSSAEAFVEADLDVLDVAARQATMAVQQATLSAVVAAEKDRLESMQASFISIVSHELQTPVAIIKAYAGTLAREDAPWSRETVTRIAHTIEEECDRLYRLITDLLDISRIQAGRVAMSIGPVDLADLAETLAERGRTRSPAHDFRTDFPPDFPIIQGDREKLRQALDNLIDNSIKYSPAGGTIVLAGRVEPKHVVLSVRDEGIGIPREEQQRVFERFHRVDTRLSRSTQGVGLGLYITKTIIDAHGGRIWVESPGSGRGSTFFIRLPR